MNETNNGVVVNAEIFVDLNGNANVDCVGKSRENVKKNAQWRCWRISQFLQFSSNEFE